MLGNPGGGVPGKPLPVPVFQRHSYPQSLSAEPTTPVPCVHQCDRMASIEIDFAESIKGGRTLVLFLSIGGLSSTSSIEIPFVLRVSAGEAERTGSRAEDWDRDQDAHGNVHRSLRGFPRNPAAIGPAGELLCADSYPGRSGDLSRMRVAARRVDPAAPRRRSYPLPAIDHAATSYKPFPRAVSGWSRCGKRQRGLRSLRSNARRGRWFEQQKSRPKKVAHSQLTKWTVHPQFSFRIVRFPASLE